MKRVANRGLALLMAVLMCIGLLTVPGSHNHAHAADFEYVYSGSYIYNWGTREVDATSLSPNAVAFYTGTNTYDELSKLSGGTGIENAPNSALYSALQTLMTSKHTYETSYEDTKTLYQYTDCENNGSPATISSFYSGLAIGPAWDSGSTWNREHTWPNSKGLGGNDENDIMMLRPTEKSENGSRGNKAYGESSSFYNPNSVSNGAHDLRGDVARIFLYVYVRWGNVNGNGQYTAWGSTGVMESLDVLIKWMAEDPVDTWELGRNDSVQSITGTRNVFVDYPELAFLMFGEDIPNDMTTPSGEAKTHVNCAHNYVAGTPVSATCTAKGYTPYTCTICQKTYNDNYTDMIDHNYVDGSCTACGAIEDTYGVIDTPVAGTAYKFGMIQENKSAADVYYLKGGMASTYYLDTTTDKDAAIDVYLEETTGGYYLYTMLSGTKTYINMVASGTYVNGKYETAASTVYTYDAASKTVIANVNGADYRFGTRNDKSYTTVGPVDVSKGNFYCKFYGEIGTPGGDPNPNPNPDPGGTTATITFDDVSKRTEQDGTHQVWVENGITVTNNKASSTSNVANYSNPVRFYKGSEVIIEYPGMTKIEIVCDNYKNTYVSDLKSSITVGTVTSDGLVVTITLPEAADTYTIAQLKGQVRVDSITVYAESTECQHAEWDEATCTTPKTCKACGATEGAVDPDAHNYEAGVCTLCGAEEPSSVPTTATITFDDVSKRTEQDGTHQVWVENGITVTNNKASSTSNVANYSNPVRFYKGSEVIIAYPGMTKIEIVCDNYKNTYVSDLKSSITVGTVTSDGLVVTITLPEAADTYTIAQLKGQVRVDSITVYAEGSSSGGDTPECQHSWTPASCTLPKTCSLCGDTEGSALGHSWSDATCQDPKTCSVCGDTEGAADPDAHNYENGSCTVCGDPDPNAGGGATEAWTLVTDVADLQVGDQIIIAAKGYSKALSTTQNNNNRGSANITKDGETAAFGDDVQIIVLENGTVSGTFAFKVGDGQYLYAASSSKNYLRTGYLNDNASWEIQIASGGAATIKAQGSSTRNCLRFNSGNNPQLFACYKSGQQDVVIYKLVVTEPVCQHTEWYEATCTDPKTCKSCGETEGEALGHNWANATCVAPKTCQREGCGLTDGVALGHSYLSMVTAQPTCNEPGSRFVTCVNGCSDSYIMAIPATGHKMINGTCTVCGITSETPDPVAVCGGSVNCPVHDFSDLKADAWYHDGLHFCLEKGLIQGASDGKFAPQQNITRAELVFALWRLEGSPVADYEIDFADVAEGQWYTEAIRWAASQNLVGGYGNGNFGTNDEITREQFATVMYRYAYYEGRYLNFDGDLTLFADGAQVSDYAVRALQWACGEGLIQGVSSEKLDPQGTATRAQAATILYRFCEK